MDDGELWETHLSLKARLLGIRASPGRQSRPSAGTSLRKCCSGSAGVLSPDALTIGFARRFATYKRANLILADIEKLASMVNDPKRPVQFVFAGKAHPRDEPGKRVLQQIAQLMRAFGVRQQIRFCRGLRHQRRAALRPGRRRLVEQSATAAGGVRHQRAESGAERRLESVRPGRLVGRSV